MKDKVEFNWYEIFDLPREVNVLGATYKINIIYTDESAIGGPDEKAYGLCAVYEPIIEIYSDDFEYNLDQLAALTHQVKHTFRHELVHAFFIEAGLDYKYGEDEVLVDFLAFQLPKIKELI